MKKYFLLLPFLYSSVFADNVVFTNPTIADLPSVQSQFPSSNGKIFYGNPASWSYYNQVTAQAFCSNLPANHTYVSFVGSADTSSTYNTLLSSDQYGNWQIRTEAQGHMESITCDDGLVHGCTDSNSANYNSNATVDDGSCSTCSASSVSGCSQSACSQYGQWDSNQSLCIPNQLGCSDPLAENYNPSANTGSTQNYCIYCSVSTPQNCSNQSDCALVGGGWNSTTSQCEDLIGTSVSIGQVSVGQVALATPTGSNSPVTTTAPPLSSSVFSAQCSSYDSNNVCSAYDYFVENAFFEFLNDTIFTSLVRVFFFSVLFTVFIWIFRFITRLF